MRIFSNIIIIILLISCNNEKATDTVLIQYPLKMFYPNGVPLKIYHLSFFTERNETKVMKIQGEYQEYYASGILKFRTNYKQGIISDYFEEFYPSGKIKTQYLLKQDTLVSLIWFEDGTKADSCTYYTKDTSTCFAWWPDHSIRIISFDSTYIRYYNDGSINSFGRDVISESIYFRNGKLAHKRGWDNSIQKFKGERWDKNGIKFFESTSNTLDDDFKSITLNHKKSNSDINCSFLNLGVIDNCWGGQSFFELFPDYTPDTTNIPIVGYYFDFPTFFSHKIHTCRDEFYSLNQFMKGNRSLISDTMKIYLDSIESIPIEEWIMTQIPDTTLYPVIAQTVYRSAQPNEAEKKFQDFLERFEKALKDPDKVQIIQKNIIQQTK